MTREKTVPPLDQALATAFQDALTRVRDAVLDADERLQGRSVLGAVPGRLEVEDVHAEIDATAELVFRNALREAGGRDPRLGRMRIVSEHSPDGYGSDASDALTLFLDPVDGTDEYLRGIDGATYSAISAFDANGAALAAGMVDVWAGKLTLATRDGVTITSLRTGTRAPVRPLGAREVPERGVIASYVGRWSYLKSWTETMAPFFSRADAAGLTIHGKGGSFVYGMIAAGRYLAYIMVGEPVDEVLPGLAFARLAGFPVLVTEEDGGRALRPFDLARDRSRGRVPFLLAACTPELAAVIADRIGFRLA